MNLNIPGSHSSIQLTEQHQSHRAFTSPGFCLVWMAGLVHEKTLQAGPSEMALYPECDLPGLKPKHVSLPRHPSRSRSTSQCRLNRPRDRQRSPATFPPLSMSYWYRPVLTDRPAVSVCVFTYICEYDCVPDFFLNCHIIHFDEDMRFLCVLCLCVFQIRA